MATIDIGKIKPVFKGTYDNSTAYVLDDIVYYNGSSYVAKTSTTGNLPTDATKWNVLASGSGGIYDSTLSIGSANQVLAVSSGGALEFQDASSGGVKQVKTARQDFAESWASNNIVFGPTATITPTNANNKILVMAQCTLSSSAGTVTGSLGLRYATGSSVTNSGTIVGGGAVSGNKSRAVAWGGNTYQNWNGMNVGYHILHAPNTTSQISYRFCHLARDAGATMYNGRTGRDTDNVEHPRIDTNITLMEIDSGVL